MSVWVHIKRRLSGFAACERGTQLVELAIVIPILILMLGAVAEFGRFFYTYTTLSKATRAGARYLITRPVGSVSEDEAKKLVACGDVSVASCGGANALLSGLETANVDIVPTGNAGVPDTVKVQIINYQYQPLFDLGKLTGLSALSLSINVSPSTTMRYLLT
jgi:Flp pilus assembly protein TadG